MNNWKNEVTINWEGKGWNCIWGGNQKFPFDFIEFEVLIVDIQVEVLNTESDIQVWGSEKVWSRKTNMGH